VIDDFAFRYPELKGRHVYFYAVHGVDDKPAAIGESYLMGKSFKIRIQSQIFMKQL